MFHEPPTKSPALGGLPSARKSAAGKDPKNSQIEENGLRYKHKQAGSPFTSTASGYGSTMSCFKCGCHRPSSELESKKILGRNHKVCRGGCQK